MNTDLLIHHSGTRLTRAAREALLSAGEQWTSMREAVFAELAGSDQPVSAYQIADNLTAARGKTVAPNSVYRILDVFVEANIALRIESSRAYIANSHPGHGSDCAVLVCEECGGVSHVDDEALSDAVQALAARRGFEPHRPVLEIRGICQDCAS